MNREIISRKTRIEFREYFTGLYLGKIHDEFIAENIALDENYLPHTGGQRRTLVEQYYHTIDWLSWEDVRKILRLYENVLRDIESRTQNEYEAKQFESLKRALERDGFVYEDGALIPVGSVAQFMDITSAAHKLDIPGLRRQIARIRDAVPEDPALAIGTAKELLETTCKVILADRQVEVPSSADVVELVKLTRKELGLLPEDVPASAKGAEVIRRLLSNLGSIAQGLAELRNLYGTGHGDGGRSKGLTTRHAKLAVGAATALAVFLLETHQERN